MLKRLQNILTLGVLLSVSCGALIVREGMIVSSLTVKGTSTTAGLITAQAGVSTTTLAASGHSALASVNATTLTASGLLSPAGGVSASGSFKNADWVSYAANTTLTISSPNTVGCSNNTATVTLQNATTAGAGYRQTVVNTAATGNITLASASSISGAASVDILTGTGALVISDGSTWWRLH